MSRRIDREQLAVVIAVVGALVALVTILFGGLLEILFGATVPTAVFDVASTALPLVGLVAVVAVLWEMRRAEDPGTVRDAFTEQASETGSRSPTQSRVGTETDQRLRNAASDWYRCAETYSVSEVQSQLAESAVRVVKTSQGLTEADAAAAIETGRWTDDPVAAAFLSPDLSQPLVERLRGALDPAPAFRRRVDRTLTAVEEREEQTTAGDSSVYGDVRPPGTETDAKTDGADDVADSPEEVVSP